MTLTLNRNCVKKFIRFAFLTGRAKKGFSGEIVFTVCLISHNNFLVFSQFSRTIIMCDLWFCYISSLHWAIKITNYCIYSRSSPKIASNRAWSKISQLFCVSELMHSLSNPHLSCLYSIASLGSDSITQQNWLTDGKLQLPCEYYCCDNTVVIQRSCWKLFK